MKTVKFIVFLLFLMSSFFRLSAYEERNILQKKASKEEVRASLVTNRQWVNYPLYLDRTGWNRFLGKYNKEYIDRGERKLGYQWQVVKAIDYLAFERTGDRSLMERPYNENIQAITDLLLAELSEGKGRFTDQLINGVFHCCEMTGWALSAHLIKQPSKRSLPSDGYQLIDLTSGNLSSLLAWAYYFMKDEFDRIDPEISRRLRQELQKRTLDPYMQENFWWSALDYKGGTINNWNPWCNSNVLLTFMLIEDDPEKLTEAVYRTMQSVDKFINYTNPDGACEEGTSYWGHAAGKLFDYLQLLSAVTGNNVEVFDEPIIKNMGEYIARSYVGNNWVVNFADASAKNGSDYPHLIYRFGKAVDSKVLKGFAATIHDRLQCTI